jgi:hypothetical protein
MNANPKTPPMTRASSRSASAEQRLKEDLLQDVFGKEKNPCRLVYGVASLPLDTPVELEVIFEVAA